MKKTTAVLCAQAEPNDDGVDFAAVALTGSLLHRLNCLHKDLLFTKRESIQVSESTVQWFGRSKKVAVVRTTLTVFSEGISFFGAFTGRDFALQADWIFGEDFELSWESINEMEDEKGQILLEVCASGGAEQEENIEKLRRDVASTDLTALELDLDLTDPLPSTNTDQFTS